MSNKKSNSTNKFMLSDVIVMSIIHMLHDIFGAFLAPILPLLRDKLSISYSALSLLSVAQRIPSLGSAFVGLLADKVNLRIFVVITPSITAIAMSLLGVATSYTFLLILLLTAGISSAIFHVPSPVMMRQLSGNRPGRGMSFYMLGGEIARTLGPLTILAAVDLWGFDGTWRLIPAAFLASFLLHLRLQKIPLPEQKPREKKTRDWKAFRKYMKFFAAIGFFLFFTAMIKSALTFYLPTYLTEKGESVWFGGIALSVFQFSGAVGTLLSGTLSDFIGRKRLLYISSMASPFLMFGFNYFDNEIITFGFLTLLGLFIFANTPILLTMVNEQKSNQPSLLNGVYMTVNFLISSIVVVLLGAISDFIGLVDMYYYAPFFAIPAVLFVAVLPEK